MTHTLPAKKHKHLDRAGKARKLYNRVVDSLYTRQDPGRARKYARSLRDLVEAFDPQAESIFTQECLALAHEAEGDLSQAIKHRENEIRLIRRLHELAQGPDAPHANFIFGQYSFADLNDRLDLLGMLYREVLEKLGISIKTGPTGTRTQRFAVVIDTNPGSLPSIVSVPVH